MWCAVSDGGRHLAVNRGVRRSTADSGALRSGRVPNLKIRTVSVAFWYSARAPGASIQSGALQAPADHGGLDGAAGLVIAPFAIDEAAGERQLIGAAVVLAQHLNRLIRRRRRGHRGRLAPAT